MKWIKLNGKTTYKNINKTLIKWDGESLSKFQFGVKQFLKTFWQGCACYEEMPLAGTRLTADLVNLTRKIAVEVHGDQHKQFVKYFHGRREGLTEQIKRDMMKLEWLELNGFQLVEIYAEDLPLTRKWFKEKHNIWL